jgi:hypothetical protein
MKERLAVMCVALLNLLAAKNVMATHLRAADIKVKRVCGSEYTFKITIVAYLNSEATTNFGAHATLVFGDGPSVKAAQCIYAKRVSRGITYADNKTYPRYY